MKKALSEPVISGPDNIEITWSGVLFLLVIFMLVSYIILTAFILSLSSLISNIF